MTRTATPPAQGTQNLPAQQQQAKPPETANLGDGQVFIGRDAQGFVRTLRMDVKLKDGIHFNKISGKYGINAEGYNLLNRIANINLIKPNSIVVDGREMPNPYVERDKVTGCVEMCWIRIIGVGFAPTGNLALVDKTLVFNLTTYFIQDLQAKVKAHPACGNWGTGDIHPKSWKITKETWKKNDSGKSFKETTSGEDYFPPNPDHLRFIPVRTAGPVYLGLWVDFSHPEIQNALNEYTSRMKFADRIADTICSRLVLAKHPAIGVTNITDKVDESTGTAMVRVYGYKHDLQIKDFKEVARSAERGEYDEAARVAGARVEVIVDGEPEVANYEDVNEAGEQVQVEDQALNQKSKPTVKTEPPADESDDRLTDLLTSYKDCESVEETEAWKAQYMDAVNALPEKQRAEFTVAAAKHKAALPEKSR